jgi:endonuclease/exonuclease/phosphatase family metal-dependent hydrolase
LPGSSTCQPIAPLDRIVVSPGIEALQCGVHHSPVAAVASDHLPVFARLELPKN